MYSLILLLALPRGADALAQLPSPGSNPPGLPALQAPLPVERPPDVVLRWNETVLEAIKADKTPPPLAARNLAMTHAAIYDAVNAISGTHHAYYVHASAPPGTCPEAAAAVAAHRTLVSLYPRQVHRFDDILDRCLDPIPEGKPKKDGIDLGQSVAERILAWRGRDGAATQVAFPGVAAPGAWQPTPPDYRAALLPQWPSVTCFAMRRGEQFRPEPPPALTSAAYTASYQEVKDLGGTNSRLRTPDQTEIAWFWADGEGTVTPPGHWNQIAQTVAKQRGTTLAENARLFALLNIALADAGISCWDCKYKFNFWRPIQGVREADLVNNPNTIPDRTWTPLLPTPNFPSYTSGHSSFSGAASAVLADFFGSDDVRFCSTSAELRGVRRCFSSFSAAAEEAGKSRIYGGIHWEFDNRAGLTAGRAIGNYVYQHFLLPRTPMVSGGRVPTVTAQWRR